MVIPLFFYTKRRYMNRVVHFEIHASDPAKVTKFYKNVFGWDVNHWDPPKGVDVGDMDYWIVMTAPEDSSEPGINGGIVKRQGPVPQGGEPMTAFVCTIGVKNIDEYISKVMDEGGKIVREKMSVPTVGWLAYGADIEGNIFGLMQSDEGA